MSARCKGKRPWRLRRALRTTLLGLSSCFGLVASVVAQNTLEQLQALAAAEQSAVETGDRDRILEASQRLAASAERLEAALSMDDGHAADAADLLTRSLALEPDPATEVLLVGTLAAANRGEQARAAAERISTGHDDAATHMALANAFHSGHDLPDTIAEIERAAALQPGESAIHLALGSAFWELNQYNYNADSLREFGEAQRLAPGNFLANQNLGTMLSQYHRYGEGEQYLRLAAQADASSPDPWLQLGTNAFVEGKMDAAREALETAVRLTGEDRARGSYQIRQAFTMLSRIAASSDRRDEAARFQTEADALRQQMAHSGIALPLSESAGVSVSALRVSAEAVRGGGAGAAGAGVVATAGQDAAQRQAAVKQLREVIARSLNDAGTALAQERDYARALPFFREAAQADESIVPVMRNLGLAAYHQAQYAEAVGALRKALELTPGDTLAQRYLEEARGAVATTSPQ